MFRRQLIQAVTWRVATGIYTRHQEACSLHLLELHPGGGQYDCLSLYSMDKPFPGVHHFDLNMSSGHLLLDSPYREAASFPEDLLINPMDYVTGYLSSETLDSFVSSVESLLGLPGWEKGREVGWTPRTLGAKLLSGLLDRFTFSDERLELKCGWHDSSGAGGSHVLEELRDYPDIAEEVFEKGIETGERILRASLCWHVSVISAGPGGDPGGTAAGGVMDLERGRFFPASSPDEPLELWTRLVEGVPKRALEDDLADALPFFRR